MKKNNLVVLIVLFLSFQNVMGQGEVNPGIDPGDGSPIQYNWYRDYDIDTLGDPNYMITTTSPLKPRGYVVNRNDCNDFDANVGVASWWYKDADGDGYGFITYNLGVPGGLTPIDEDGNPINNPNTLENSDAIKSCVAPPGYVSNADDCYNQDGTATYQLWYYDEDGDGFGNPINYITSIDIGGCTQYFAGYSLNNSDCNDLDDQINPNTRWFLDTNNNGSFDLGIDTEFRGCTPPNGNYISVNHDAKLNWIHSTSFDMSGNLNGSSRVYFDELAKPTVSISKDFINNNTWKSEVIYDSFGRQSQSSFPTISTNDFQKIDVLSDPTAKSQYLDTYYSNANTLDTYQATAAQPYSEIEYDKLNPGNVIKTFGGNQIGGEWKSGYSYTVPAAQEMYYLFGYNFFNGPVVGGKEEIITKFYKTVSVDANGVENVAFSDGEGKTLAVARAGASSSITPYQVHSLIGTQGYVDVHIPAGIATSQISLIGGTSLYNVYNLKTGQWVTPWSIVAGNAYRIQAVTAPPTSEPKVYVTNAATGALSYDSGALGISYFVNYYDYSFNIYDATGRLKKSVQPNGFRSVYPASPATFNIVAAPAYMSDTFTNFSTTYKYDALGKVIEVNSKDEGLSKFAYRQDGQIRYSQSALQANTVAPIIPDSYKVSYTNYDSLSRPIESGVLTKTTADIWTSALANVDNSAPLLPGTTASERTFTIYDDVTNNTGLSVTIPASLSLATLTASYIAPTYADTQRNLAGNVAVTYKADADSRINHITWYSYDIYGRVTWVVQYDRAMGDIVKTIDYVYDKDSNVAQVIFQKDVDSETFTHRYTYDANSRLITTETAAGTSSLTEDAHYYYNVSGQLSRLRIGEIVQGIDYVYTLGGSLKSINHPSLEKAIDPGKDGLAGNPNANVTPDLFGITLDYFAGDYNRSGTNIVTSSSIATNYSGNIMGSRWATRNGAMDWPDSPATNTAQQKGYLYNYNRNNWLIEAKFGTAAATGNITTPTAIHREQGLQYDANGNITKLQRTGLTGATVDNLTYNYTNTGTNQLNRVVDAVTSTGYPNDIKPGQAAGNYFYNVLGQLISNFQEKTYYTYNTQGLVSEIRVGGTSFDQSINFVRFFYNERGHRIRKESLFKNNLEISYYVVDASGNAMAIYQQTGPSITQTELPIYGASRLGVYMKNSNAKSYQLTDHLGNVRAVAQRIVGSNIVSTLSYADYYPFGEQLDGRSSASNYRYAYQGQERDGETGMEAFQLRLWDGRLGRWLSPDPYGQYASPYLGMGNDPVNGIDPDGGFWQELGNWIRGNGWNSNEALAFQKNGGVLGEWIGNKLSGYRSAGKDYDDPDGIDGKGVEMHKFKAVDDLWDNSARRIMTGDKIGFAASWDASFFIGGGTGIEMNWILTGKDKSFFPYIGPTAHITVATGGNLGVDFSMGKSWHSGPSTAVSAKSLPGWEHGIEASGKIIGGGSLGYSYSPDGKYGWHTVNGSVGAGFEASPFTAVNVKYTATYNFLQLHTGTGTFYTNN